MQSEPVWQDIDFIQGYWRLGDWGMSRQETSRFLQAHLALGIQTVDHADIYGDYRCEALFGDALSLTPHLRDQFKIVTKCGIALCSERFPDRHIKHYDTSATYIRQSVENSLKRLRTDHIDVLLIHRPDHLMDADVVAGCFEVLRREGKVQHFGVSNFTPQQFDLLQSRLDKPLVTNQIEINPLALGVFEDGTLEHHQMHRIRPMVWSALAGGRILADTGATATRVRKALGDVAEALGGLGLDQVLYAWLLHLPGRPMPIIGSGNIERVASAVASANISLTTEQWYHIWVASTGVDVP